MWRNIKSNWSACLWQQAVFGNSFCLLWQHIFPVTTQTGAGYISAWRNLHWCLSHNHVRVGHFAQVNSIWYTERKRARGNVCTALCRSEHRKFQNSFLNCTPDLQTSSPQKNEKESHIIHLWHWLLLVLMCQKHTMNKLLAGDWLEYAVN